MELQPSLRCRFVSQKVLVGDIVDQLGCVQLSSERDAAVEICKQVIFVGDVPLEVPALTFDGK